MSGIVSYHAGLAAEGAVAADYGRRGLPVVGQRWRGAVGEIDLIVRDGPAVIFVEVKRARDFARAAERLTRAQAERIWATATEFLAGEPRGQLTEARFDLALVDGVGRVRIIENVTID
ncbi:MAG: YraN family protein [Paracoccaceae bacterium]|nr:YraN family protein [Paracoccaceae bacterium]